MIWGLLDIDVYSASWCGLLPHDTVWCDEYVPFYHYFGGTYCFHFQGKSKPTFKTGCQCEEAWVMTDRSHQSWTATLPREEAGRVTRTLIRAMKGREGTALIWIISITDMVTKQCHNPTHQTVSKSCQSIITTNTTQMIAVGRGNEHISLN